MGLQEEEEVIKERSPIAERIWSNGGFIQEDRCRMYTGGLVRDLYRMSDVWIPRVYLSTQIRLTFYHYLPII